MARGWHGLIVACCALALLPRSTYAKTEDDCPEATAPAAMVACASDLDGSKKRLNQAYGVLAKKVGVDFLPLLEKAQKAWLGYRNAQCDYVAEPLMGGSMVSAARLACTVEMNVKRAQALEADAARWQ